MGCHSDPACRDESTRFPRNVPWRHLPTWKRKKGLNRRLLCELYADRINMIDDLVRLLSD